MNCRTFVVPLLALFSAALFVAQPSQLTEDQKAVLEDARAYALQYAQQLPDFICTQITHRDVSAIRTSILGGGASGASGAVAALSKGESGSDIIEEQLTYVGGKETYEVVSVDGKKVNGITHMDFAGAVSAGEFGSVLTDVFDPASHTVFTWDREADLHGRHVYVYQFRVPKESGTTLIDKDTNQAVIASITGRVFIDPVSFDILQIYSKLDIPPEFPIRFVERKIEYTPQEIAGKSYSLPSRSEMHMQDSTHIYNNRIDFKNYHRFTSESTIHVGKEAPQ